MDSPEPDVSAIRSARAQQLHAEVRRRGGRLELTAENYRFLATVGLKLWAVEEAADDLVASGRARLVQRLVVIGDGPVEPLSPEFLWERGQWLMRISRRLEKRVSEYERSSPSAVPAELRAVLAAINRELQELEVSRS